MRVGPCPSSVHDVGGVEHQVCAAVHPPASGYRSQSGDWRGHLHTSAASAQPADVGLMQGHHLEITRGLGDRRGAQHVPAQCRASGECLLR